MTVYAPPGTADSLVTVKSRYDHFIGGEWVDPGQGQLLREHLAGQRQAVHRDRPRHRRGHRGGARRRARRGTGLGQDVDQRSAPTSCSRSPTASRRTSRCSPSPRPGTTASRSARPWPPTCRWPSTTSATSPACSAPRRAASARSTPTPCAYHFHEPLGVVAQIIPWNFPILMAVWKLAPGPRRRQLRRAQAGRADPVVDPQAHRADRRPAARPACSTSSTASASRPASRCASPSRIAKVAFTGETTTGRLIMQYASQNLIPVTLELGGKSPNIFFEDVAAPARRLLRQGARGLRDVRPQPGRGLHLPVARAGAGVDLRRLRRTTPSPGSRRSSRATRSTTRR